LTDFQIAELFGVDFMLDDDLNLWFIECNSSPVLKDSSDEKGVFLTKMLTDMFEVVLGMLRSRMKRLIIFCNEITKTKKESVNEYVKLAVQRKDDFDKAMRNKIETEYLPNKGNGWQKIIDENHNGVLRYAGLLSESCLHEELVS